SCPVCKRKGLDHAVTEKRVTLRKLRRVRPFRRLLSRRSRVIFLVLSLLLLLQLIAFEVLRSDSPFAALIHGSQSAAATPSPTPTPRPLTASRAFEAASASITTLALAPDGKILAGVQAPSTGPVVGLWDTATGKRKVALTWPATTPPGALVWSHDGRRLAASDGSAIGVWETASHTLVTFVQVPAGAALRVVDAATGEVIKEPSASTAFADDSVLRWGTNGQLQQVPANTNNGSVPVAPDAPGIGLWQA